MGPPLQLPRSTGTRPRQPESGRAFQVRHPPCTRVTHTAFSHKRGGVGRRPCSWWPLLGAGQSTAGKVPLPHHLPHSKQTLGHAHTRVGLESSLNGSCISFQNWRGVKCVISNRIHRHAHGRGTQGPRKQGTRPHLVHPQANCHLLTQDGMEMGVSKALERLDQTLLVAAARLTRLRG